MQFKNRLKPTRATLIALILITGFFGLLTWELFFPHRYESSSPLTLAQAKSHTPIPLPSSATNIHIATYKQWIQFVQYVRFEAPVADCLAHAKSLIPDGTGIPVDFTGDSIGPPFNPGAFHDLSPFDLRTIKNGVQYGTGGPSQPRICIDKDRGVFFFYITD